MTHVHACPGCYERFPCQEDCTVEPDLGKTLAGLPFGHTTECARCRAPSRAVELVRDFEESLIAEGFDPAEDAFLRAALTQVADLLGSYLLRRERRA